MKREGGGSPKRSKEERGTFTLIPLVAAHKEGGGSRDAHFYPDEKKGAIGEGSEKAQRELFL